MKTRITSVVASARERALDISRKVALAVTSPTEKHAQMILLAAGVIALGAGLSADAIAQAGGGGFGPPNAGSGDIEDGRIANAVATLFRYLEGSFGALIMAGAGIMAIASAAFGQYKAAMSCMIVAVGAFILRSFMNTFFNTSTLDNIDQSF
jgi:hypothetical protein